MAEKNKKLKMNPLIIIIVYTIILVLVLGLLVGGYVIPALINHTKISWPSLIIFSSLLTGLIIVIFIISLKNSYYVINKNSVVLVSGSKTREYFFKDVLFIEEEFSKKHMRLKFYTNKGEQTLFMDKKKELLSIFIKNSNNLISRQELDVKKNVWENKN